MSEQIIPNLGELAAEDAWRDAIHVAVAPVVAASELQPGQHVGVLEDGRADAIEKTIGIVDPFLTEPVHPGERFWLLTYPNTITSLRHVWTHPAFRIRIPQKPQPSPEQG